MKVISGDFSQEKEAPPLGERLANQLDKMGIADIGDCSYVLIVDVPEATYLATNGADAGNVLLTMKKAEISLMSSVFEECGTGEGA